MKLSPVHRPQMLRGLPHWPGITHGSVHVCALGDGSRVALVCVEAGRNQIFVGVQCIGAAIFDTTKRITPELLAYCGFNSPSSSASAYNILNLCDLLNKLRKPSSPVMSRSDVSGYYKAGEMLRIPGTDASFGACRACNAQVLTADFSLPDPYVCRCGRRHPLSFAMR